MVIHNVLRRVLRVILNKLTRATLAKHRPDVIAIIGSGPTGIIREAVYTLLHENYPVRRNLESPESEFSVPLTILGSESYPRRALAWLALLIKSLWQLLTIKPYFHILILEMGTENSESFKYWLEMTGPKIICLCGTFPLLNLLPKAEVHLCPATDLQDLEPYRHLALEVARTYRIKEQRAQELVNLLALPQARIQLKNGRGAKIIIDSTYHYYPPPLKAVTEIAEALNGKTAVFLDESLQERENSQLQYPRLRTINDLKGTDFQIIVVRGPRIKMRQLLDSL